jgi:hypothetical protein
MSKNEIKVEFKSKYEEMWVVFSLLIFTLLMYTPFIVFGSFESYWYFILLAFFGIVTILKVFHLKNDIKQLEKEFDNLLRLANSNQ